MKSAIISFIRNHPIWLHCLVTAGIVTLTVIDNLQDSGSLWARFGYAAIDTICVLSLTWAIMIAVEWHGRNDA